MRKILYFCATYIMLNCITLGRLSERIILSEIGIFTCLNRLGLWVD